MDTRTSPARLRIERIQDALRDAGCAAVVIPSSDPHLSEYLPERWQARQWASGFTGSMATLIVTSERAALFADSRYWVQAECQLAGSGIELVRIPTPPGAQHLEWLGANVARGSTVAVDGNVIGLAAARQLRETLERCDIVLRSDLDIVAAAWPERPEMPSAPVYEHTGREAPHARAGKLEQVRAAMRDAGATHHLISTVDDIAWLLNLRGADVGYNPVFLAHLLLDATSATLYVGAGKIDAALAAALGADGVRVAPYDGIAAALAALPAVARLLVDPRRTTLGLVEQSRAVRVEAINPSTLAKSRKTEAEAANVRRAMVEDGVAMCEFYAWFEAQLADPKRRTPITELTIDEKLAEARA
ncbi:MAG: aminopeptidase P family N-terminal domain-containing protein, partial [Pseudomonadota bacterium]|nr:aminopeptidase P family N-terminal domain-containing protein [Pseudomonadota bacterium]